MNKTKYEINRNNGAVIFLLIPIICAGAAELLAYFSSEANSAYAISVLDEIMFMSEFALALLAIVFVLSFFLKGQAALIVLDVLKAVAVVLLCVCLYDVLEERATLMGYVWFSDLESGNENSVNALNYGVISAVLYVVSIVSIAVTGCINLVSAKKIDRTPEVVRGEIEELQSELAKMTAHASRGSRTE